MPDIQKTLRTYGAVSTLANVYRHNTVPFDAERPENVAEHSYSLAVLGAALADEMNQTDADSLDLGKITQFAVVHDLVEAYMDDGDISVYAAGTQLQSKKAAEANALEKLEKSSLYPWIAQTIKEYEQQETSEARYIYALDKIIVHMNVILADKHHVTPTFERYLETEKVARQKIEQSYPDLLPYFEELSRIFREKPHFFTTPPK